MTEFIAAAEPVAEHTCPHCHGGGTFRILHARFVPGTTDEEKARLPPTMVCSLCKGSGKINDEQLKVYQQGQARKEKRLLAGYGMRHYAEDVIHCLPSNISKMENGLLPELREGQKPSEHPRKYGPFEVGDHVCDRGSQRGYAWDVQSVDGDTVTVDGGGIVLATRGKEFLACELEICEREEWC